MAKKHSFVHFEKKHGWQTASHCLPPSGNMAAAGAKLGNDVSLFFHF